MKLVKLVDYKPYPFDIPFINLHFAIFEHEVTVNVKMLVEPVSRKHEVLILQGVGINLEKIAINDLILNRNLYEVEKDRLIIQQVPNQPFELSISSSINPYTNTTLEGLYLSSGILTTQCEAEGFRRICYHPDRPDVLSIYTVTIEADKERYPVLLSNGNLISSEDANNCSSRHVVLWKDPHPKPSYLFALVAGQLDETKEEYRTFSGKNIIIKVYVEPGDQSYINHAISSLKRAIDWDETVYGLIYDLDEYNIVAIRHFNMGAMENKGLNIFNSKLILADTDIATDDELERIESVIAHEYFHNWTGNRITLRDWFQLSLKEGLTVFRDQSFTANVGSYAVKRVNDVALLRNTQFLEDSGPTSHPVKPDSYFAIDNFYSTTIYEKGAELIRMLFTLLGESRFMRGISLYIKRHDGRAATTEDFIKSVVEGACSDGSKTNFDVDQFCLWYHQKGTPHISASSHWDSKEGSLTINIQQKKSYIKNELSNTPLVIPILLAVIPFDGSLTKETLLVFDQFHTQHVIKDLPKNTTKPAVSFLRGFTAPVKFTFERSIDQLLRLINFDNDPFSRWESSQTLTRRAILSRSNGQTEVELEKELINTFSELITDSSQEDPAVLATLLRLPGLSELESYQELIDPISLYQAKIEFESFLGENLSNSLRSFLLRSRSESHSIWPQGQGIRKMIALSWRWLSAAGEQEIIKEALQAVEGDSMTLSRAALEALRLVDCPERELALKTFYERWNDRPVILDSWFRLEASVPWDNGINRIQKLFDHPKFDPIAPNAVRAVLGGLSENTKVFHNVDGQGYEFMAQQIVALDKLNPITASRLTKVFSRWRNYLPKHRNLMHKVLIDTFDSKLSSNTKEVVELILS